MQHIVMLYLSIGLLPSLLFSYVYAASLLPPSNTALRAAYTSLAFLKEQQLSPDVRPPHQHCATNNSIESFAAHEAKGEIHCMIDYLITHVRNDRERRRIMREYNVACAHVALDPLADCQNMAQFAEVETKSGYLPYHFTRKTDSTRKLIQWGKERVSPARWKEICAGGRAPRDVIETMMTNGARISSIAEVSASCPAESYLGAWLYAVEQDDQKWIDALFDEEVYYLDETLVRNKVRSFASTMVRQNRAQALQTLVRHGLLTEDIALSLFQTYLVPFREDKVEYRQSRMLLETLLETKSDTLDLVESMNNLEVIDTEMGALSPKELDYAFLIVAMWDDPELALEQVEYLQAINDLGRVSLTLYKIGLQEIIQTTRKWRQMTIAEREARLDGADLSDEEKSFLTSDEALFDAALKTMCDEMKFSTAFLEVHRSLLDENDELILGLMYSFDLPGEVQRELLSDCTTLKQVQFLIQHMKPNNNILAGRAQIAQRKTNNPEELRIAQLLLWKVRFQQAPPSPAI